MHVPGWPVCSLLAAVCCTVRVSAAPGNHSVVNGAAAAARVLLDPRQIPNAANGVVTPTVTAIIKSDGPHVLQRSARSGEGTCGSLRAASSSECPYQPNIRNCEDASYNSFCEGYATFDSLFNLLANRPCPSVIPYLSTFVMGFPSVSVRWSLDLCVSRSLSQNVGAAGGTIKMAN